MRQDAHLVAPGLDQGKRSCTFTARRMALIIFQPHTLYGRDCIWSITRPRL